MNKDKKKDMEKKPADPKTEKRERTLRIVNIAALMAVFVGITLFMTFGKRPNVSYTENRDLEKPPEFTWEGYFSGYVTDQFAKYYNDTVPQRATWKLFISNFRAHLGVKYGSGVTIVGDVPVIENPVKPNSDTSGGQSKPANSIPDVVIAQPSGTSSETSSSTASSSSNPKVPDVVIPNPNGSSETDEPEEPAESNPDDAESSNPKVPEVVIPSIPIV